MTNEFDTQDQRLTSLYIGTVVRRDDPDLLGRVRVNIPGVIEPESAWAFPMGTMGGGIAERGFFAVPEIGAEVGILFKEGDPDSIYYLAGAWGIPESTNQNESPAPIPDRSKERAPNIRTIETRFFRMTFDDNDREGADGELLEIVDKVSGDGITIDRSVESGPGILIQGSAAVLIETTGLFKVKATSVQINDRIILPEGKPI